MPVELAARIRAKLPEKLERRLATVLADEGHEEAFVAVVRDLIPYCPVCWRKEKMLLPLQKSDSPGFFE